LGRPICRFHHFPRLPDDCVFLCTQLALDPSKSLLVARAISYRRAIIRVSSLCVSLFVADRKQLQIAGGIAAHGAQQTEVSGNKTRTVVTKPKRIANATPAWLLPRETATLDKNSATTGVVVGGIWTLLKKDKRKRDEQRICSSNGSLSGADPRSAKNRQVDARGNG